LHLLGCASEERSEGKVIFSLHVNSTCFLTFDEPWLLTIFYSRAKIISELRENQRQTNTLRKQHADWHTSQSWQPTPGLMTSEIVDACIDFFFRNMYPTMPVLHRERLYTALADVHTSSETYCLVAALCAFMIIQPGMQMPQNESESSDSGEQSTAASNTVTGMAFLEEAVRVRKSYDYVENPTLSTIITSFFLFGCYFGIDKHNSAWFYLREATTFAHVLGLQTESTYLVFDPIESERRRRTYWLLFLTERYDDLYP
jgi:Fungal specific transcription factor domain